MKTVVVFFLLVAPAFAEVKYVDRASLSRLAPGEATYINNSAIISCKGGGIAFIMPEGATFSEPNRENRQIMVTMTQECYLISIPEKLYDQLSSRVNTPVAYSNARLVLHKAYPLDKKLGSFWKLPLSQANSHPKLVEGEKDLQEAKKLIGKLKEIMTIEDVNALWSPSTP